MANARSDFKRLKQRYHDAPDRAARDEIDLSLRNARRRMEKAEAKLARFNVQRKEADNAIVGGPVGLRSGGVGIIRVGAAPRGVGDSTAVNRKHGFRRR